jgi:uncharacterized protein (DUF2141 family)
VIAWAALGLLAATAAPDGTLTVRVANVRNAKGVVHMDVCPKAQFLKDDCPWSADAPAHPGETIVVIRDLPPGDYAVQGFHDENGNGKVDRALFGAIPKEGIAFSRDAPIHLSPPKWADAVFAFDGHAKAITLKMRYMLGPSGPGER